MSSVGQLRILLVGKGGREHALAWKLSQSPQVEHIFVLPGNGGTAHGLAKVSNLDNTSANDYPKLVSLAKELHIGLVVVGPEDSIVDGIEGYFREGHSCHSLCEAPFANKLNSGDPVLCSNQRSGRD